MNLLAYLHVSRRIESDRNQSGGGGKQVRNGITVKKIEPGRVNGDENRKKVLYV